MSVRKTWMLGIVILCNSFVIPTAFAVDDNTPILNDIRNYEATNLPQLPTILANIQSIVSYLTTAQAQIPPGTTVAAQAAGTAANAVENNIYSLLLPKELADLNWSLYAKPLPYHTIARDEGEPHNLFLANHQANYCAPSSGVENFGAETSCNANATDMTKQHGDLRISSLLGPSMYDSNSQSLAEEVIRTLTVPFPSTDMTELLATGLTKNKDISTFTTIMAKHAAINAARNSLNEIYAARLPTTINTSRKDSLISIMESEAQRRFQDPNNEWYTTVQKSSDQALLRELVHMEAYRLWTDYYRYRQNERVEALLAVMTTVLAEQSLQMTASMSKYTK